MLPSTQPPTRDAAGQLPRHSAGSGIGASYGLMQESFFDVNEAKAFYRLRRQRSKERNAARRIKQHRTDDFSCVAWVPRAACQGCAT